MNHLPSSYGLETVIQKMPWRNHQVKLGFCSLSRWITLVLTTLLLSAFALLWLVSQSTFQSFRRTATAREDTEAMPGSRRDLCFGYPNVMLVIY